VTIAARKDTGRGYVKGEPVRYIVGHHSRLPTRTYDLDPNPSGKCWCGCGRPTEVATRTYAARGEFAGHHKRYVKGHNGRLRAWRQRQAAQRRSPCLACFELRPAATIVDGVCALCLLRRQRQQLVSQRLQDQQRAADERRRDASAISSASAKHW
jgi:hypothetical protein